MSNQDLAYNRKYRPSKLSDYIGNEKIKKGVKAMLRGNRRPQVILMSGQAGGGKTTMARLLAKEYLCENRNDETGACGVCYNCKMLTEYIENGDAGSLMNVREIDVTDSNKKQDIDDLLEDASVPSFDGNWKIYILDECHSLSNAAQNRLLKNLEEPAERVLMVLCTTDPEKLLDTVKSRCQYTYKVTKPTRDELALLLARVCRAEGVEYDNRALSLVCVSGQFIPRNTLIALEKVVRECGKVTYNSTVEALDIIADKYFFSFYGLLLSKSIDIFEYVKFLGDLRKSTDLKDFISDLVEFTLRGIYILNGVEVEALDNSEVKRYKDLFKNFNALETANLLTTLLAIKGSKDIELELMLLGYKGLRNVVADTDREEKFQVKVNTGITPTVERLKGDENFDKMVSVSDDTKVDLVEKLTKKVDIIDIAKAFGGTIIEK